MGITIDRATKYTSGGHLITRLPSADDIVPITTGDVIVITQRGSCHAKRRGETLYRVLVYSWIRDRKTKEKQKLYIASKIYIIFIIYRILCTIDL